jgi:hypothetical protein
VLRLPTHCTSRHGENRECQLFAITKANEIITAGAGGAAGSDEGGVVLLLLHYKWFLLQNHGVVFE